MIIIISKKNYNIKNNNISNINANINIHKNIDKIEKHNKISNSEICQCRNYSCPQGLNAIKVRLIKEKIKVKKNEKK